MRNCYIIISLIGTSWKIRTNIWLRSSNPNIVAPIKTLVVFLSTGHPFCIFLFVVPAIIVRLFSPSFCRDISVHIIFSLSWLNITWIMLPTIVSINRYGILRITLSFLWCNHYYTIGSAHTINCSRGIFQYRDRFYIVKVHVIKLSIIRYNTVNYIQWSTHITYL